MRDSNAEDQIDALLDAALASYSGAEADDAGRTHRILARVAVAGARGEWKPSRKRWLAWGIWTGWKTWAIAIPAAACLVLVIALTMRPRGGSSTQGNIAIAPERTTEPATERSEVHVQAKTALPHAGSMRRPSRVAEGFPQQAVLPKLEVFPTPLPLSTDERKLAAYAVTAREPVRKSLVMKTDEPSASLNIAFIEIPPVVVADKLDEPPDQISRKPGGHGPMN